MYFNTNVAVLYMLFYVLLPLPSHHQKHKSWLKAWILESDKPRFKSLLCDFFISIFEQTTSILPFSASVSSSAKWWECQEHPLHRLQ